MSSYLVKMKKKMWHQTRTRNRKRAIIHLIHHPGFHRGAVATPSIWHIQCGIPVKNRLHIDRDQLMPYLQYLMSIRWSKCWLSVDFVLPRKVNRNLWLNLTHMELNWKFTHFQLPAVVFPTGIRILCCQANTHWNPFERFEDVAQEKEEITLAWTNNQRSTLGNSSQKWSTSSEEKSTKTNLAWRTYSQIARNDCGPIVRVGTR